MILDYFYGKDKECRKLFLVCCDECGKKQIRRSDSVYSGRKKRKSDIDLCKKCSYLRKYGRCRCGILNPRWKGGITYHSAGYKMILTYPEKFGGFRYKFEHILVKEKELGRELFKNERIHHIDLDKLNNLPNNLFVCDNERYHQLIHKQMQKCGYKLLDNMIWFDCKNRIYSLCKNEENNIIEFKNPLQTEYKLLYTTDPRSKSTYAFVRIDKRIQRYHVFLIERHIGRKIFKNECVHHIDGNTLNNYMVNLCLMTGSEHSKCHKTLECCVAELYKKGIVDFDKNNGKYFVKEIIDKKEN